MKHRLKTTRHKEIKMPADIMENDGENLVLVATDTGEGQAWHNLGNFVGNKTAVEAISTFKGGVPEFEKAETFFYDEGELSPTGEFMIVRKPMKAGEKKTPMGNCKKGYHIVQPKDIAIAFDERVGKSIETLGFLGKGDRMFTTWAMPRSIFVGGTDEVKMYGTLIAGFDGKVSLSLSLMDFRVVCRNTSGRAEGIIKTTKSDGQSVGAIWVGRHNSPNIYRDMCAWMGHLQKTAEEMVAMRENLFNKLFATPVDNQNVLKSLVEQIYPKAETLGFYPDELRTEKEEKLEVQRVKAEVDQQAIIALFGGGDKTTQGNTAWDLFNNVTYYENHVRKSKKDTASSICFGNRSDTMNDALVVLADYSQNF
jgi:hypothetical protein